jgi:hypothetical protein
LVELRPRFFYDLGYYIHSLLYMRADLPHDVNIHLLTYARIGLTLLASDEKYRKLLPKTTQNVEWMIEEIDIWSGLKKDDFGNGRTTADIPKLHDWVKTFSTTIDNELDDIPVFSMTNKGALSVKGLLAGASSGYPPETVAILGAAMQSEIDEAGRCLACGLNTACGFHILRSVEIGIKAYIHAAIGSLPPIGKRNWGEYIIQLQNAGASADFVDFVRILKTKRNPLMHPQDTLSDTEAIDIFNICQAAINALVSEIKNRSLESRFASSLAILPTI